MVSLCGFFLMFGARKMSENARASSAFSAAFLAASYIFHRCKPDTVHGLFFLGRRKTNRFIEWQTIRRRIEGYRLARVIFKQASKHPCADPAAVIPAIHEEKTDMLSIRPDGDLPNQFFSIKSAVILQTMQIIFVVKTFSKLLCSLCRVIRGFIFREHDPCQIQSGLPFIFGQPADYKGGTPSLLALFRESQKEFASPAVPSKR